MKSGQLVKWSSTWLAGCTKDAHNKLEFYREQIGVVVGGSTQTVNCWTVIWNNGERNDVHYEFLEAL